MPTNLGPAEILVILVVALIVLGPNRLPEAGRQVGRALAEVRRWSRGIQTEIRDVLETEPDPPVAPAPPLTAESGGSAPGVESGQLSAPSEPAPVAEVASDPAPVAEVASEPAPIPEVPSDGPGPSTPNNGSVGSVDEPPRN